MTDTALTPMQQALLQRFDAISAALSDGVKSATAQLPDIAQQLVMMGRVRSTIAEGVAVILILAGAAMLRYIYFSTGNPHATWKVQHDKWEEDCIHGKALYDDEPEEPSVPGSAVVLTGASILSILVGAIAFSVNLSDFCLSWFAPKVYILQQLKEMLA